MAFPFQNRVKLHDYDLAPSGEDDVAVQHQSVRSKSRRLALYFILTALASSVVSFGVSHLLYTRIFKEQCPNSSIQENINVSESVPEPVNNNCGSTASEARANGCQFDVLAAAWTPDLCYDAETSSEYFAEGWPYYADSDGEEKLPPNQVVTGMIHTTYTTQAAYLSYCLHTWLRLHRMVVAGEHLDSVLGTSLESTYDCINFFRESEWNAKQDDMAKIGSAREVTFRSCE